MPRLGLVGPWVFIPGTTHEAWPRIPQLPDVWWRLVSFVLHLRNGAVNDDVDSTTQRLDASTRRQLLSSASMYVFGVDLSVPGTRIPEDKLARFVSMEDACRRPTFQREATRQFLIAALPFLSGTVRRSPAEIAEMMARGETPPSSSGLPVYPRRPRASSGDAPSRRTRTRTGGSAPPRASSAGDEPIPTSKAGFPPRPSSNERHAERLRIKANIAAHRARVQAEQRSAAPAPSTRAACGTPRGLARDEPTPPAAEPPLDDLDRLIEEARAAAASAEEQRPPQESVPRGRGGRKRVLSAPAKVPPSVRRAVSRGEAARTEPKALPIPRIPPWRLPRRGRGGRGAGRRRWVPVPQPIREETPEPARGPADAEPDADATAATSATPAAAYATRRQRERRHRKRSRFDPAGLAAALTQFPGPDEYVLYDDELNPVLKRMIRETGRRRWVQGDRYRSADPDPPGFWQDRQGRWFYSRGPVAVYPTEEVMEEEEEEDLD